MIQSVFFVILAAIGNVLCQSGTTQSGRTYICLPVGSFCPTNGNGNGNVIDPRIVTPSPSNPVCPTGYFACYGTSTQCGRRLITQTTTADGTSDPGAYPWQAYLRNNTHAFAGSGVLIDNYHVLTAAHKVYLNVANPSSITVIMGVWNPANLTNTQSSTVVSIKIHPLFVASTLKNDIAVLRLAQPIVFGIWNNVNTACVPSFGSTFVGRTCVVSGWGQTSFSVNDAPTTPQKQVNVQVVSFATCRASYSQSNVLGDNVDVYLDPQGEICAGGQSNRDACTQDGGSPLMCYDSTGKLNVAGLVIWGKNCGRVGVYGVYVSVPYYSNWIGTTIESLNSQF